MSCKKVLAIGGVLLIGGGFCGESTELPECEPYKGRFIQGIHFIPEELIKEKGYNYQELAKIYEKERRFIPEKHCLPLED